MTSTNRSINDSELDGILEHFNSDHADTVLFLARHAAACPDATSAEAVVADAFGIGLEVVIAGRSEPARVEFAQPASTAGDVHRHVVDRVTAIRAAVGDREPLTSLEQELQNVAAIQTHVSTVAAVSDLSPNLRQVVLTGEFDRFGTLGGDQFVYLMVRRPDGHEVPADHSIAAQSAGDPDTRPLGAYYTVRSWEPTTGRLTLWMVRHRHDGTVGGWADRCEIGERVAVWGPRPGFGPRPDARHRLLVADESGLAAIAVLLDELPPDATATVLVETIDADHVVALPRPPGVETTWRFRGADESGTGSRLFEAVRGLDLAPDGLIAFGAAESRQMTEIRRYLRNEVGMPAPHVSMTGYWRRR